MKKTGIENPAWAKQRSYFSVRMNFTTELICSLVSLPSYFGILSLPLVMMLVRSVSDCFCTSSELRSRSLSDLPIAVAPLPSAPWHMAHFALKISAPSSANDQVEEIIAIAMTQKQSLVTVFILVFS